MNTQIAAHEWSVDRIYQAVGDDILAELEASGQSTDNAHFFWGAAANQWINVNGMPAMQVYAAIARKIGRSVSTVRNCYYTFRAFSPAVVEEFHMVPWSVFNHARLCDNPESVLDYCRNEHAGVDEVEAQFPVAKKEEVFSGNGRHYPVWATPIRRRFLGLDKGTKEKAERLLTDLINLIGE